MSQKEPSTRFQSTMAERAIGIVFLGVAVFLVYSLRNVAARPAAFPMALLTILGFLGLIVALRSKTGEESKPFRGAGNVMASIVIIFLYVIIIDVIGFLYATMLFFVTSLVISRFKHGHRYRYPLILLIAVTVALTLSRALVDLLKLPMP